MDFLVYKKFNKQESARELSEILTHHGIEFQLSEDRESLDALYGDKQFDRHFFVKIRQADFAKADAIVLKMTEAHVAHADKDHYLFTFSDEELLEILAKPDEWNEFDYLLAKKILKERGKDIDPNTIDLLKKQRIKELAKPEDGQRNWIYAGYLCAIFGGLLGILIGWHLSTFKKTLPNGQRVYGYTEHDRRSGTRMMIIGIVMFILIVTIRIGRNEFN
jgi:hypothetical protein